MNIRLFLRRRKRNIIIVRCQLEIKRTLIMKERTEGFNAIFRLETNELR